MPECRSAIRHPRAIESGEESMSSAAATFDALVNRVGHINTPFTVELPDGEKRTVGQGQPEFEVALRNDRALRAIRSLDEGNIAEAYLQGDLDLEGDMLKPFELRASLDDRHPLVAAWRFVEPLLFGQVYTNKRAISSHYNADPKLFLSFLDPVFPAYSQGVYEDDDEPLSTALQRKFDWAIEQCGIGKGTRVLEIGQVGAPSPDMRCKPARASPASPIRKFRKVICAASSPISATISTSSSPISTSTSRRRSSTPSSSWA